VLCWLPLSGWLAGGLVSGCLLNRFRAWGCVLKFQTTVCIRVNVDLVHPGRMGLDRAGEMRERWRPMFARVSCQLSAALSVDHYANRFAEYRGMPLSEDSYTRWGVALRRRVCKYRPGRGVGARRRWVVRTPGVCLTPGQKSNCLAKDKQKSGVGVVSWYFAGCLIRFLPDPPLRLTMDPQIEHIQIGDKQERSLGCICTGDMYIYKWKFCPVDFLPETFKVDTGYSLLKSCLG